MSDTGLIRTEKLSDGQVVFRAYDEEGRCLYQWCVWRKRAKGVSWYENDTISGRWKTQAAMKLAFTQQAILELDKI